MLRPWGTLSGRRRYGADIKVKTRARPYLGGPMSAGYYILLLFDVDDDVVAVRTIAAPGEIMARRIATDAETAHGGCVGYQLWRGGRRIAQTYPAEHRPANFPMSLQ